MQSHRYPVGVPWPILIFLMSFAMMVVAPRAPHAIPTPMPKASHVALPQYFEANQGQTTAQAQFISRGPGYTAFLTPTQMVFRLSATDTQAAPSSSQPQSPHSAVLRMQWLEANAAPQMTGLDVQTSKSHYLIGQDPQQWHLDVAHYAKVRYTDLYPGVDLVVYGHQQQMAYDLIVAPKADVRHIALGFQGTQGIEVDSNGDLRITLAGRTLRMRKPFVYQDVDGQRQEIPSHYVLRGPQQVGFDVAAYDATQPLVIDPILNYSTFLGGQGQDIGHDIAVDPTGQVYITGRTTSTDFPTTATPLQDVFMEGINDAFVAKLTPNGSALVYATYLGGSGSDIGHGVAAATDGHAYIVGETSSTDFPVTPGALQTVAKAGDAFIVKLSPDGSTLAYATRLGGANSEVGHDIAVDTVGHAYVTGRTPSNDFPTSLNALQPTNATGTASPDAFVAKLNPQGSALLYSTFLGGSGNDVGHGIAIDAVGNAYVTGDTTSTDFPLLGPIQMLSGGGSDAFVAKINADASALLYSTYLGGAADDTAADIAIDATDNAYVVGSTSSEDFPVTQGAFQMTLGDDASNQGDAWIVKVIPDGTALAYASYLGGSALDEGHGVAVDTTGRAFVTGATSSLQDFPTLLANAIQTVFGGGTDAFFTQFTPDGSALLLSSYIGSTGTDQANAITLDTVGNAYLLGQSTVSDGFPLEQPLQPTVNGSFDAFIMKIGHLTLPAVPICDISMTQSIYQPGEQAIAAVIRVINPGPQPVPLELKIWRQFPDGTVVPYLNIGADGQQLIIPAESEQPYVPLPVLNVVDLTIKGRYEFNCRLLEPFTGKLIAEDRNPFDVQ